MIGQDGVPRFGWFYGDVCKRLELPFLTLTELCYPAGFEVPTHRHDDPWFGLVLEGTLIETYRNRTHMVQPLNVMFRVSGESHSDRIPEGGARCLVVDVKQAMFDRVSTQGAVLNHSAEFAGGTSAGIMCRMSRELRVGDSVAPLAIEGLLLEMLAETHRRVVPSSPKAPDWLKRASELLNDRFSENLSLGVIAAEVQVHPVHLARTFRQYYRSSVGDYLRLLRIKWSYKELITTNAPVIDIALRSGFCDQPHFCKTFKRLTGMSPSELRKSRHTQKAAHANPSN